MSISTPVQITVPFATSGLKNAIPGTANPITGNAGYDLGFPAINMTPKTAGGIPPFGQDFNGVFFDVTTAIQYLEAGGSFPYSSTFSTAVGGYPLGAIVSRTDGSGLWRNTVANNTTNPETFGANWQPEDAGSSPIAMTNANVTLTALQAARSIIIITGVLTTNLQLIFPAYIKQWLIVNNGTGGFTVTAKTLAGSGVAISTGASVLIYGDGTNILASQPSNPVGIQGNAKNLIGSATGLNAAATYSADEIILESAGNAYQVLRSVSITPSFANAGANGLDVGAANSQTASTWYSIWVIWNGTTTSGLLSLSTIAPTLPSGYTHKARVGWVRTDGTANKFPLSFKQLGRCAQYVLAAGSNVTAMPTMASGSTAGALAAVAIGAFVPPTASIIYGSVYSSPTVGANYVQVAPNNNYPITLVSPGMAMIGGGTNGVANVLQFRFLLESTNIYWVGGTSAGGFLQASGWEDNL